MNELENLVACLEAIAKKNKDRFGYSITIDVNRGGCKLLYRFEAKELADGHVFVDGTGPTIELAVAEAIGSINEGCESWGYKS